MVPFTHSGCGARGSQESLPRPRQQATPEMTGMGPWAWGFTPPGRTLPLKMGPWTRLTRVPGSNTQVGPATTWQGQDARMPEPGEPVSGGLLALPFPGLLTHRVWPVTVESNECYGKWPRVLKEYWWGKEQQKYLRNLSTVYTAQQIKHFVLNFRNYILKQDSH